MIDTSRSVQISKPQTQSCSDFEDQYSIDCSHFQIWKHEYYYSSRFLLYSDFEAHAACRLLFSFRVQGVSLSSILIVTLRFLSRTSINYLRSDEIIQYWQRCSQTPCSLSSWVERIYFNYFIPWSSLQFILEQCQKSRPEQAAFGVGFFVTLWIAC